MNEDRHTTATCDPREEHKEVETMTIAERMFAEIEEEKKEVKQSAILTGVTLVGLLLGVYFQITDGGFWWVSISFLLAYLAGGLPAAKGAFTALFKEKSVDIDLLMVLAALAAAGVGEVRDGAILLFLFSLAGTLEGYAMGNTKRAVAALMKLRPDEANVLQEDGATVRMLVEKVAIRQRIIVKPGERIPLDGVIVAGEGAIDQSSVTGESVPVDKVLGDQVFSGTVNQNSVLTIEVTKTSEQSTIAKMIELVTKAQEERSPSESFSDWFGEKYTYVVLFGSIAALGIFFLIGIPTDEALYKAATLLVVASPCAIVISVPAAILSGIAAAARTGALFKGGAAMEEFGAIDTVAFDKTGTLTNGKMEVTDVHPLAGHISLQELVSLAGAIEAHSEHPVAASIRAYCASNSIAIQEPLNITAVPGKGITALVGEQFYMAGNRKLLAEFQISLSDADEKTLQGFELEGKTAIVVATKERALGIIAVADTLRESAITAIESLRRQGVKRFVMLTGDNRRVAYAIGSKLEFNEDDIWAELLPEDKVTVVNKLKEDGKVAFVGDGINDAAALASSHVGIAMGVGGSDVAIEAADIALLAEDLHKLSATHKLAKDANTIIKQNLYFAVGIMVLMVFATIFGNLPLPLGVIGHEGGTLLVVANGLRLLFKYT